RQGGRRDRTHRRGRPGDARRVDLRPGADGRGGGAVGHPEAAPLRREWSREGERRGESRRRRKGERMSDRPGRAPRREVELTIDGASVRVPEGTTLLEACRAQKIDTPTLCYLENLTPVNVCRV